MLQNGQISSPSIGDTSWTLEHEHEQSPNDERRAIRWADTASEWRSSRQKEHIMEFALVLTLVLLANLVLFVGSIAIENVTRRRAMDRTNEMFARTMVRATSTSTFV